MLSRGWFLGAVLCVGVISVGCKRDVPPPPPPPPPPAAPAPRDLPEDRSAPTDRVEPAGANRNTDVAPNLALPPVRDLPPVGGQGDALPGAAPSGKSLYNFKSPSKSFGVGKLSMGSGGLGGGGLGGGSLGGSLGGGGLGGGSLGGGGLEPLDMPKVRGLALKGKLADPVPAVPTSRPTSPSPQPTTRPAAPSSQPTSRPAAHEHGHGHGHEHRAAPVRRAAAPAVRREAPHAPIVAPPPARRRKPLPKVVARVNNEPISRATFVWAYTLHRKTWERQNGPLLKEMLAPFRKKVLSRSIDEFLIYQRAVQQGVKLSHADKQRGMSAFKAQLPPGTDIRAFFFQTGLSPEQGNQMLLRQLYLEKYKQSLVKGINVTKDMIKAYYKKNAGAGKVRARHIVINVPDNATDAAIKKARKRAKQILKLAKEDPRRFPYLARKYSNDPSAKTGGSLGEVTAGDMIKAIDEVLFSLQTGQVGGPVQTAMGFHIFKVDFRRPARSLMHMQAEIMRLLFQKKVMKLLEAEAQELRKEAQIEILVPWGKD